ncbi:unnamed protein product [Kuraishia capsulata CBS 1993]|uniref:Holocytochrome c-type synthase n=1 Tax=Kuraishia capsulata CBS 1993 TaxID=1382522 RepID=W6MR39_9ASCO|nr:uncharacterized protein KUCA_T00000290001 [Kuraishia capsulata CBS 1993]CDK24330.1 unnamed protein product [Kuraishia capsulata CBS 1993]
MSDEPKCPVDHSTREAWLKNSANVAPHPIPEGTPEGATCPVNHEARQSWVSRLLWAEPATKGNEITASSGKSHIITEAIEEPGESCSSGTLQNTPAFTSTVSLPTDREISTIPRTGAGENWVYPSQKQFFEAMQRKKWNPEAQDMKSIVPIHNAVNERAWYHIRLWELGQGGDKCGGIQLTSFKGESKKLTPRARMKCFFGYEKPFDRHDWTINRCGKEIDYVIDFYGGKADASNPAAPSFYLDVRPKLNSFEGIRLRVAKALGF